MEIMGNGDPMRIQFRGEVRTDALIQALTQTLCGNGSVCRIVEASKIQRPLVLDFSIHAVKQERPAEHSDSMTDVIQTLTTTVECPLGEPLVSCQLLQTHQDEHCLQLTFSGNISCTWSLSSLMEQLRNAYLRCGNDVVPECENSAARHTPFAVLPPSAESCRFFDELAYWRRELFSTPLLQLRCDFPRPVLPSEIAGQIDFELRQGSPVFFAGLDRSDAIRFFSTILSAYQTLLYRYTGDMDLVVGSVIKFPTSIECDEPVSVLPNILPLRGRIFEGDTVRQFQSRSESQKGTFYFCLQQHHPGVRGILDAASRALRRTASAIAARPLQLAEAKRWQAQRRHRKTAN